MGDVKTSTGNFNDEQSGVIMAPSEPLTPRPAPDKGARQVRARAAAQSKRDALRRRARRIRHSVAVVTAVLFCTLFLVVYVQLASGHDPALSATSKNTSTSASDLTASSSSTTAAKKAAAEKAAAAKKAAAKKAAAKKAATKKAAEERAASEAATAQESTTATSSSGESSGSESSSSGSESSSGESSSSVGSVTTSQS
jgi:hypothetical protein